MEMDSDHEDPIDEEAGSRKTIKPRYHRHFKLFNVLFGLDYVL